MATVDEKIATLREQWYEFKDYGWEAQFGSPAVEVVKQEDRSGSYEMDRGTLFLLKDGRYALVTESGCSCYDPYDASIEVIRGEQQALAAFDKWAAQR